MRFIAGSLDRESSFSSAAVISGFHDIRSFADTKFCVWLLINVSVCALALL